MAPGVTTEKSFETTSGRDYVPSTMLQEFEMNRKKFYDVVRSKLGRLNQSQVLGFEDILDAFEEDGPLPIHHEAYMLATAWHETGKTMQPIRETFAESDDQAIARLDKAFAKGQLTWVSRPYWRKDRRGLSWFGRGLVQITHEDNYAKADNLIGSVGLKDNPSLALVMDYAIKIMIKGMQTGMFRGRKLSDYTARQYVDMRDIINADKTKKVLVGVRRTTMGQMIAEYALVFEQALRAAQAA